MEVHHIVHVRHGGNDKLENLQTLCKRCHKSKHMKPKPEAVTAWDFAVKELMI